MKKLNINYYLFLLSIFCIISCTKDVIEEETIPNKAPIASFDFNDLIDNFELVSNSTDEDGDSLSIIWSTESELIKINSHNSEKAYIYLPVLEKEEEIEVHHIVSDGILSDTLIKTIRLPQTTNARKWGLGTEVIEEKSNNVEHEWYIDQKNTGTYYYENCGPSVATMSIKWINPNFNKTAEDARNTYRPEGGWWYTYDITNYLLKNGLYPYTEEIEHCDSLTHQIDEGNIVILCLDMYYVQREKKSKWRVDKFYLANTTGWGHFIILKGYKKMEDKVYFEVYDPYSMNKMYDDTSYKGKDRYYSGDDLEEASKNWWHFAIIVSPENVPISTAFRTLNESIPHQSGQ
ncbi:hypothetical protein [Flammeovirga sp. SJP92]|uniref:hypothetical protein n=1 Tax=Flammeovirga sp. SJP92 TaxID=1775430 RepID=UPI00078726A9|nr:hypothetical protein [Flammeovirga sp. SJP92]KXX67034.1 hypothetical protein AVL50_29105 [Flammeovirga sp. SJP92]